MGGASRRGHILHDHTHIGQRSSEKQTKLSKLRNKDRYYQHCVILLESTPFVYYVLYFVYPVWLATQWNPNHMCMWHQLHSRTCLKGGYPSIRHNEIRDFSANLLSEVCHNVSIEPHLQPITGEILSGVSATRKTSSRWFLGKPI